MKYDHDHYRSIKHCGYVWGGFDSDIGMHMFSRQVLERWEPLANDPTTSKLVRDDKSGSWHGKWENVLVTEQDLEDGNAEWMMENGYTRNAKWMIENGYTR